MKKLTLLIAVCAMFILSCDNNLLTKFDPLPPGMGSLIISFNNEARAVVPDTPVPDTYVITFTPQSGTPFNRTILKADISNPIILDAGTYTVFVQGFISGNLVAQGSAASNVVITDGSGTTCYVTLKAIIIGEAGAKGTFYWAISLPNNVTSATMTIKPTNDTVNIKTFYESTIELAPGYYNIEIVLERTNDKTIKHMEIVHIYQNLTSTLNIHFTEDHFNKTSYTLYLNYNDGVTLPLSQSVYHGDKYTKPSPDPTRNAGAGLYLGTPSVTFAGWYLDGLDILWDFAQYAFIGDTTLYAKWNSNVVDLTGVAGSSIVEQAFNYVNANANAGAYTLLVDDYYWSMPDVSCSVPAFDMSIRAVTGSSSYVIDARINVTNGRLAIGNGIRIQDWPVAVSPNGTFVLSGNAEIDFIDLQSIGTSTASISLEGTFTGQALINLFGSGDADAVRSLWKDKQIIKGYDNYPLKPSDISRFDLNDFVHSSGTTPISATHELELVGNAAVLREKAAAPVTVSVGGGAANPFDSLDLALGWIGTQTDDFTVTLYADQTMTAGRIINTAGQNIKIIGDSGMRTITYNVGTAVLFNVGASTTLTIGNNITIQGRSTAANYELIAVNGTLIMEGTSFIKGHNVNGSSAAIDVNNGIFIMNGGTITGNNNNSTNTNTVTGGVRVPNGTLKMNGGSITGNTQNGTFDPVQEKFTGGTNEDVYVSTTTQDKFIISDTAVIGSLKLYAFNSSSFARVQIGNNFKGNINKLHLYGNNTNMDTVIGFWVNNQIIQGEQPEAETRRNITSDDVSRIALGNFYSTTAGSIQAISPAYIIGTTVANIGKLIIDPATAPVTVNDETVITGYLTLLDALTAIGDQTGKFNITLRENQTMSSQWTLFGTNQHITITGETVMRTIDISNSPNVLFYVNNTNASLTLGENITIQGRSNYYGNAVVIGNGTFKMQDKSRITGNTANGVTDAAVVISGNGGNFVMEGGSIDGNINTVAVTAPYANTASGGVRLTAGKFEMSGSSTINYNWHGSAVSQGEPSDVYHEVINNNNSLTMSDTAEIGALKLNATYLGFASVTIGAGWNGRIYKLNLCGENNNLTTAISYWNNKQIFNGIIATQVERIGLGEFISSNNTREAINLSRIIGKDASNLGVLVAKPVQGSAGITITLPQITDLAPTIPANITIYLVPNPVQNKSSTFDITLQSGHGGTGIKWYVDGTLVQTDGDLFTLSVTDNRHSYNGPGVHTLTLEITIGGKPYSKTVNFTVAVQ